MILDKLKTLFKYFGYNNFGTRKLTKLSSIIANLTSKAPWVRYRLGLVHESILRSIHLLPDSKSQLGQNLLAASTFSPPLGMAAKYLKSDSQQQINAWEQF